MKKDPTKKRSDVRRKPSKRSAIFLIVGGLVVLGLGGWWLWPEASPLPGGMPRLALDRTEIDLGDLRFGRWAEPAFNITNTGNGLLTLESGPVRVVQGC